MRQKLTKALLATTSTEVAASGGRCRIFDSEVHGFGVNVHGSGASFFVYYGPAHARRMMTLGRADVLSVEEARRRAKVQLGEVAGGKDPQAAKATKRSGLTLGDAVDRYLDIAGRRKKQPRHDKRYLGDAKGRWGSKTLSSVTRRDVEEAMKDVAESAAAGKGGTGHTAANRWLASVRKFFADAIESGEMTTANPAAIKKYAEGPPRARVLTDDEYARALDAIDSLADPHARTAFLLLMHTGARKSEVLTARRDDFDLDAATWRIPSPKAGHPQTIPLDDEAVALIKAAGAIEGNPYLIPGHKHGHHRADVRNEWAEVRAEAGIADVTIHDLRRTFGKRVAQAAGLQVASRLLRHADIRVTERVYAGLGFDELRAGLDKKNKQTKTDVARARKKARGG